MLFRVIGKIYDWDMRSVAERKRESAHRAPKNSEKLRGPEVRAREILHLRTGHNYSARRLAPLLAIGLEGKYGSWGMSVMTCVHCLFWESGFVVYDADTLRTRSVRLKTS